MFLTSKNYLTLYGIVLIFILTSCYSNHINIQIKTDGTIAWNKDSSAFVFVAQKRFYVMPVGIAKFPDGGHSKTKDIDFSIYYFNINKNKLKKIASLNEFYLSRGNSYTWLGISQVRLYLQDSLMFYKMEKPDSSDFNYIKQHIKNKKQFVDYIKNFSVIYKVNIKTLKKESVDTNTYKHFFDKKRERMWVDNKAKKYIKNLTYTDWGINLKKLCNNPKKKCASYIVNRCDDKMLNSIFQQIVPDLTNNDKIKIIKQMMIKKQELYSAYKADNSYKRNLKKQEFNNYINYIDKIKKRFNISDTE